MAIRKVAFAVLCVAGIGLWTLTIVQSQSRKTGRVREVDSLMPSDVVYVRWQGDKFRQMFLEAFRKAGFGVTGSEKEATIVIVVKGAVSNTVSNANGAIAFPWVAIRRATQKKISCSDSPIRGERDEKGWHFEVMVPTVTNIIATVPTPLQL